MPTRTEAGQRLFVLLEEHGWTDGAAVRLTPLVRSLAARGIAITRGQLAAVLYAGQEPSAALLRALARGLRLTPAALRPPKPPAAHKSGAHPLATLEPIDDARAIRRRKQARRRSKNRGARA
jgi:transcriptional regulator with XRE-family HTH domain